MHVDDDLFRACGNFARRLSLGEAWTHHTPTPKGRRTPTARCLHTHLPAPPSDATSLPPTIPGGRTTKDPGAPLLSAVCASPSPLAFSWIWSCEDQKKLRGYPPGWETSCGECLKLHAAKSLHLAGTPQLGKCRENGRPSETARNSTKCAKSARGQTSENRGPGRSEAPHPPRARTTTNGADETARRDNTNRKDSAPSRAATRNTTSPSPATTRTPRQTPRAGKHHPIPKGTGQRATKNANRWSKKNNCVSHLQVHVAKNTRGYCTTLVLAAPSLTSTRETMQA